MAKEKTASGNNSGSRLRENVSKIFDCFLIVNRPSGYNSDLIAEYKYPPDFDDAEILQQSLLFCFPFDPNPETMLSFKDSADHFSFILTDIEGKHRFGFCKLTNGGSKCYCILSFVPWFEIFYKILNYTHELSLKSDSETIETMLIELHQQDVPGSDEYIRISTTLAFQPPNSNSLPSIPENRNLSEYFAAVNINFMMEIFASLMFERRVIFTSSQLSILTSCVHSAETLLNPLHWQHIYIPVMPPHLIDYCLAPMPYLVGVHSSLMPKVREMIAMDEDIIIADIDTVSIQSIHNDLERIPSDVVSFLKSLLKKPAIAMEANLSTAFLRTQARLIGGYRNGLRFRPGEEIIFDEETFISYYKSTASKEFARSLVQLQTFKQFVDGRLELLNTGVGFKDMFENEVNMADAMSNNDKESYKEWLVAAKRGGNKLMMQFQRKAKDNMKVAQQSLKNYMKNQQIKQQASRKKSLDEATRRIRPSRPTSQPPRPPPPSADKLEELKTHRLKPPERPPPPVLLHNSPNRKKKFSHSRRTTRRYTALDLDGDDQAYESAQESTVNELAPERDVRERSMSNATYTAVNVDLLADIEVVMDEKITNLNSPSNENNNSQQKQQPDLLLDLFGGVSTSVDPSNDNPEEMSQQPKQRTSSSLRRHDHVTSRPHIVKNSTINCSSEDSSPGCLVDADSPLDNLVDLSITSSDSQTLNQPSTSSGISSATQDLIGLDFGGTSAEQNLVSSSVNWVSFDHEQGKTTVDSTSGNTQASFTTLSMSSSSKLPPVSSPSKTPNKLSPEKLSPFRNNANPSLPTNKLMSTHSLHSRQSAHILQRFPQSSRTPLTRSSTTYPVPGKPNVLTPSLHSPVAGSLVNKHVTSWQQPNANRSSGTSEFMRGGSLRQPLTSKDNELFSDLLGTWKSREGL